MRKLIAALASVALLSSTLLALPAASASPDDIIAARRANQKRVGELADAIDAAIKASAPAASLVDQAKELDDRAHMIKGYFPDGTQTGNTKARPEIWSNRAGFEAAADRYTAAFDKLLVLAKAGDNAGFATQFAEAAATCGACHRNFRSR